MMLLTGSFTSMYKGLLKAFVCKGGGTPMTDRRTKSRRHRTMSGSDMVESSKTAHYLGRSTRHASLPTGYTHTRLIVSTYLPPSSHTSVFEHDHGHGRVSFPQSHLLKRQMLRILQGPRRPPRRPVATSTDSAFALLTSAVELPWYTSARDIQDASGRSVADCLRCSCLKVRHKEPQEFLLMSKMRLKWLRVHSGGASGFHLSLQVCIVRAANQRAIEPLLRRHTH